MHWYMCIIINAKDIQKRIFRNTNEIMFYMDASINYPLRRQWAKSTMQSDEGVTTITKIT
jgi:hypothetical protein